MTSITLAPVSRTALSTIAVLPRLRMVRRGSLKANATSAISPTVTRDSLPVAGSTLLRTTTSRIRWMFTSSFSVRTT